MLLRSIIPTNEGTGYQRPQIFETSTYTHMQDIEQPNFLRRPYSVRVTGRPRSGALGGGAQFFLCHRTTYAVTV